MTIITIYHLSYEATDRNAYLDATSGKVESVLGDHPVAGLFRFYDCTAQVVTDKKGDDALEFAFWATNSIDRNWWEGIENTETQKVLLRFRGDGCRSTSVGDLMVVGNSVFAVDRFGFRKVFDLFPEFPVKEDV